MPACGAAILATWYDLPDAGSADYIDWLHNHHMPALLRRPGYLWGAHYRTLSDEQIAAADGNDEVIAHTRQMGISAAAAPELGRGSRYLTLVGGANVSVFMDPLHSALDAAAGDKAVAMLALRQGVRTSVLQDLLRQSGPGRHARDGDLPGPRIQMGTLQTAPDADIDLWRWYLIERLPLMAGLAGTMQTRLMAGAVGWAKLAVLYEFADADAHALFRQRGEQDTIARHESGAGTLFPAGRVQQAPYGPTVADRIWPLP